MNIEDVNKITRFEVIDHREHTDEQGRPDFKGRIVVAYGVSIEPSLQDDGRTLKIFLDDREP